MVMESVEQMQAAVPPPPPPPPPMAATLPPSLPPTSTLKRSPSIKSTATIMHQDELNLVLTMVRQKHKPHYEVHQTPEVYIDQKSTPSDVQTWLRVKEFDSQICAKFKGVSGHNLFDFTRMQLEKICGDKEGKRLHSQLTIQKSVSGYQTMRSSELKAILAKAREKIESDASLYT